MKIVYIPRYTPIPDNSGARMRNNNLWRALESVGEVRLIVFGDKPPLWARRELYGQGAKIFPPRQETARLKAVRQLRSLWRHESMLMAKALSPRRVERLVAEVRANRPEVIVLGDTYMTPLISKLKPLAARLVVDCHNVESRLFARMLRRNWGPTRILQYLYYRNVRQLERLLAHADEVWSVSEEDASYYRDVLGLKHVKVVPNVIDLARYDVRGREEEGAIVYTGLFSYWPNGEAALRLIALSKRLKQEDISHTLYLVGRGPARRMLKAAQGQEQVVITGEVRDTRPYIAKAAVFAAPLTAGSGTKLKVLEAMALARPVLTTPVGAEGLGITWGHHAVVAAGTESFYSELTALLGDAERRRVLGRAGRDWVVQHHSMDGLAEAVKAALGAANGATTISRTPIDHSIPS